MIRLPLTDAALADLRIAPSPLWDTLSSLALVAQAALPPFPYRSWARTTMSAGAGAGIAPLLAWARSWPGLNVPTFLVGGSPGTSWTLDDELDALNARGAEPLRAALDRAYPHGVPPAFQDFHRAPQRCLGWLRRLLRRYWAAAIQPYRIEIQQAVEEDVLHQAQILVSRGTDELLGGLHPRIRWVRPELSVQVEAAAPGPAPLSGLTLVPLLFARERVVLGVDDGRVRLGYQSRGSAKLTVDRLGGLRARRDGDGLAQLLGNSRAALLRCVVSPSTTTALAAVLGLAPSTVSEHLTVLVSSAVVQRQTVPGKVLYSLTDQGYRLLAALDGVTRSG